MTLPFTPDVPAISFGYGKTAFSTTAGQPVTVWLSTLYNTGRFVFSLTAPGTVQQASTYEYTVTCNTPGTYSISLAVTPHDKRKSLVSNILTLTVK